MLKVLLVSIGLVLVIEGVFYFLISDKLNKLIKIIEKYNKQQIKIISLTTAFAGLCLIYITFRIYGELK
tara:strand:+ start:389 stop:595 length:207 start_codon:yes stop_codon:yes gene_type:complete